MLRVAEGSRTIGGPHVGAEPTPASEAEPQTTGILERAAGRFAQPNRQPLEIDGFCLSPAAAKFLSEHDRARLVGIRLEKQAREKREYGRSGSGGTAWVAFDPSKHTGASTRVQVSEFFHEERGHEDEFPMVWQVRNGQATPIGHALSVQLLIRMRDEHTLSQFGQTLLTKQGGEPVEELIEEVMVAE